MASEVVKAFSGHEIKSVNFYATKCVVTPENGEAVGWQAADSATNEPDISVISGGELYNRQNSAYVNHGTSSIACSDYSLLQPKVQAPILSVATATTEITANIASSSSAEAVATSTVIGLDAQETVVQASSSQATSSEPSLPEIIIQDFDASSGQVIIIPNEAAGADVQVMPDRNSGVDQADNSTIARAYDYLASTINFAKTAVDSYITRVQEVATAEKQEVIPARFEDIGYFKSAKINLSLAEITRAVPKILRTETGSTTNEVATSTQAELASGQASTTAQNAVIVDLDGNNLQSDLIDQATGELSIWYSVSSEESAAADGRIWWKLGQLPIDGLLACQKFSQPEQCFEQLMEGRLNAGYFSLKAPILKRWQDISSLQVKFEVTANSDKYEVYLDGSWVAVDYTQDEDDTDDGGYDPIDKLVVGDQVINFQYTDENQGENLLIRTNSKDYADIANSTVYFSVTNQSERAEHVNLQAHFPVEMGSVYKLERLRNGRWTKVNLKDQPIDEPNAVQKFFGTGQYERKPIKENMRAKNSTDDGGILIKPGLAQYYRMVIQYPAMSSGEFYIEVEGDGQGYGLLDPWWSSSWGYKLPITIDNTASANSLTDYQVLVEIASTTSNFWNNVNADGSDLRFLNASGTVQLNYWNQYFSKTASSAQIWVQVDNIPANASSMIYLYYGNTGAASTSNMYSTFSYSTMQDLYYVVTNTFATVTVVSLIDNNQVQFNNGTAINLNRQQIATFTPVTATSVLRALGPVQASVTGVQAGTTLLPIAYAGTAFAVPYGTNVTTEAWSRYAPFAGATTTIYNANTLSNTTFLATGTALTTVVNISNGGTTRLLATNPVLAAYYISNTTYSGAVYPATVRDLYGIFSGTDQVGFTGNTTMTVYCSNNYSLTTAAQSTAAMYAIAAGCTAAAEGAGSAVRLTGQVTGIGAIQFNDSDGTSRSVFLPDIELATEYMVPRNAAYIAIACPPKYGTSSLSIYNQNNVFVASSTCTPTGEYPGKAYFGVADVATYNAGSRIVSTNGKPFYAYYEDVQALVAVGGDESNFIGAVQARKQASVNPIITLGVAQSYRISVSGKVYSNDGLTPLLTKPVVALAIEGAFIASTTASSTDGSYVINNVIMPEIGSSTAVFLASSTISGVAYNRYQGAGDISNYDIYQNRIIVRHDDIGPLTNSNIDTYDADQNPFIKVRVASSNLLASSTQKLYVWPSNIYQPNGSVTLPAGSLQIATSSTLNAADNLIEVGGSWLNQGTFQKTSIQTTTFSATSSGNTIDNGTSAFNHLVFNGVGGGWSFATSTIIDGNLSMATGTLSGTNNLTVNGGNATGTGAINLTGGTFTLDGSGNFGSNQGWAFYDLTLGDGLSQATTTMAYTGTSTVANKLTVSANQYFNASSSTWILAGSGTPFVINGAFNSQTSTFRYTATSATEIAASSYYNLQLAPTAAGSPIYTLATGSLSTGNYLAIGNGAYPVTVTALANNTALNIASDLIINSSGALIAATSSNFSVAGSWLNSGNFSHSSSTVNFNANSAGKLINAGNSPFYNVIFNNPAGGWTVAQNATSTNDWTLTAGTFTASSSTALDVGGQFYNAIGGASTTWTGSTLYLRASGTISSKAAQTELYDVLKIAANTDVKMWNSSASSPTVDPSGSLYSMNHGGVAGNLNIWGDYHITAGVDNWSYATDFDGTDLSGLPRQAHIAIAANSTVNVDGGTLNILGSSTFPSVISNQGSGVYSFNVSAGAFDANYYRLLNLNTSGLNFAGSPIINSLDNGDFQLAGSTGNLISLVPSVMQANPDLVIYGCNFATTTTITAANNVYLSAAATTNWTFANHTGGFSGENYDGDPASPVGYLIWDDSPQYTPKSQNWRWYSDINNETPSAPLAAENVAPINVVSGNSFKLRTTIDATNVSGTNVKMRLQYSTTSDFSNDVYFVGEIGSTTAWTYADGIDLDNATITTRVLTDSAIFATHNESGTSTSAYAHPLDVAAEWEFTLKNNNATPGLTYYFRPYTKNMPATLDIGATRASLVVANKITIAGTAYSNLGSSQLLTGSDIGLAIGNQLVATTTTSLADGSFSFSNLNQFAAGSSMALFFDNSALEASTTITYFNSASTPLDNTTNTTNPTVVTPPNNMLVGDLVILEAAHAANTGTLAMSATGGQAWTALTQRVSGTHEVNLFWARFNGTWTANPSVNMISAVNNIVVMHVFRPGRTDSTWAIDVPEASAAYAASTTPYIPSVTTLTDKALVFAVWTSAAANTWGAATAGWVTPGTAQYRCTSGGSRQSVTSAYMIKATAGPTGAVSKTQSGSTAGTIYSIAFKEVKKPSTYGVSFNRYAGSGDISNYNLYQDSVIVRHDDAGPISNSDINNYDADLNPQIKATVTVNNLIVLPSQMLYIWPGSTFRPGGQVSLSPGSAPASLGGDLQISNGATLNADSNDISIGGDWLNYGNLVFGANQDVYFTATSTGFNIAPGTANFNHVNFTGTNGGWSFSDNVLISGNLNMATGTLSGTSSITIYGGNATGTGLINLAGGIFTIDGTGDFGGPTNWNFYDLHIGDGTFVDATSKIGSSTVTVNNVMTINNSQTLKASTSIWSLVNSGTPFVVKGILNPDSSTFRYLATVNTNIATTTYYNLELVPNAAGSPTYTLQSGLLSTGGYLKIGNGANPVTVTAATNNTQVDINGDFNISAGTTYIASGLNGMTAGGNWTNLGAFTANGGVVTFDASTTGKIISASSSSFATVAFNNTLGGWTINQNATTTGNFNLATGSQFTLASGATLEVQGQFINNFSKASTTWTGSTLFINGTSQNLNTKYASGASFGTLQLSGGIRVKMWNSSAATSTVPTNSSLYSMDNNSVDGNLYIWGNYLATTTEYWSYNTDFDGTDITATPRAAAVRIASSSSITISTTTLFMLGSSTAATTINSQGVGTYALNISSSTLNANYFQVRNISASGLNITGSSTMANLSHGDLQLQANGNSVITLSAQTMDQTGASSWPTLIFATSSGVSTGYNVNLVGTPNAVWDFSGSTGSLASDNFDNDSGDPRGFLIWSDSPYYAPKSQDWRWYYDEYTETPTRAAAPINIAPANVLASSTLKLRLGVKETGGVPTSSVKMRLQYSVSPTFASGVYFVGELGSTTALWVYADGLDTDGALLSTATLASSTLLGTHNESGTTTSNLTQTASSVAEFEFTIQGNGAASGTTYFFRAYTPAASGSVVFNNTGYIYPSIVPGDIALGSIVTGLNSGATTSGITTNINAVANTISFGTINFGTQYYAAHRLLINTNAESGYQIFVQQNQDLTKSGGQVIVGIPATNDAPAAWSISTNPGGFGYHTSDDTLSGASPSRFAANNTYSKLETTMREIGYNPLPSLTDTLDVVYRMEVTNQQQAGDYTSALEYIVVPTY